MAVERPQFTFSPGAPEHSPAPPSPDLTESLGRSALEFERAVVSGSTDTVAWQEFAREDRLRQGVFHLLLDGTLERPRTVHRVVTRLAQQVERRVIERELEVAFNESLLQLPELDVDDGADLRLAQWMEHADVIDAVDELRTKVGLHHFHDGGLHLRVVALARKLLDDIRTQI